MNPPNDDRDPLDDAYRHASAGDAGRPAASTRDAILKQAAAAARQRAPAANDRRYLWRSVAGVAVLGVAVLLWQQVDRRMPGDQVVTTAQPERENAATESPTAQSAPEAPASQRAEPFTESRAANEEVKPRREESANLQAAERGAAADAAAEVAEVGAPAQAAPAQPALAQAPAAARAAAKMSAAQDAAQPDPVALLQQHFPAQYQSDATHSLWLVQDATGSILLSGELPRGSTFGGIRADIERDLGGRLLRPWRIHTVRNARGHDIELAVSQTP